MNDWITLALFAASVYAFVAAVVAIMGLSGYALERQFEDQKRLRLKAARQVKYAIIWPVLIPRIGVAHFFEDLWRDMRGGE